MSDKEAVEQLATAEQHQPEQESKPEAKAEDKEINFREMRRGFDELRKEVGKKDQVIDELRNELSNFKTKVKTAFDVHQEEEISDEDEPMTKAEFKRSQSELDRKREIEDTPRQFTDYYDVIKYAGPMLMENPALIEAIEKARNPRLAAYQLVKSSYAYRSSIQKSDEAKEIAENIQKPKVSESLVGGSSSDSSPRRQTLQEKAEVWKMAQRYARGG